MPKSETELREALAECDAVCTSGCHADDCEHHGHLPALAIPVEPALREAAKRVVEWAEWHEPWNPSGDFDALRAALASIPAEPEQADEGLDVWPTVAQFDVMDAAQIEAFLHARGYDKRIDAAVARLREQLVAERAAATDNTALMNPERDYWIGVKDGYCRAIEAMDAALFPARDDTK